MICPSCQADNPSAARFCCNCGSRLVPEPAPEAPCRVCAALLPLDARFCGYCGTPEPLAAAPGPGPGPGAGGGPAEDDGPSSVDDEDEATVLRPELAQAPMGPARPGIKQRERLRTEPAVVASARTLAERLGRGPVESAGTYSKKGPSLRKAETKDGAPTKAGTPKKAGLPPPPPPIGSKTPGPKKSDTAQQLPRAGLPPRPGPGGARPSSPGPVPGVTPRPGAARAGSRSSPRTTAGAREEARPVGASAKPAPRGPRMSETAAILAPPEGWPDLTDELAEVRFSTLQGVDADEVVAEVEALRRKYPGHPEVEALAAELGVASDGPGADEPIALPADVPSAPGAPWPGHDQEQPPSELTPMNGPPPRGRFPVGTGSLPEEPLPVGTPRPAPFETSDELLDDEAVEFDELEPGPGDSMSELTLVESLSLDLDEVDGLDTDDDQVLEEPDFVDRTMIVPSLQPPAPYEGDDDERSTTLPPGGLVVDREDATFAGFELDGEEPTLAGMASDEEEPSTLSGIAFDPDDAPPTLSDEPMGDGFDAAPSTIHDSPTPVPGRSSTLVPELRDEPPPPAPFGGLGGEPPPEPGMTAPDRDADTVAASGTFNVADLDLDDMPDLSSGPPPELELDSVDTIDPDAVTTDEGTVIARAPQPPAPFGQPAAPVPVLPVRLVMLGARGEPVAERRIEPGTFLDVGRQPGEPWAEDRRMAPLHARLFPGPGGVIVDDLGLPSGVYTQIVDTIAVEDGDELKVGQARLALQRVAPSGGTWGQLTLVRHDSPTPEMVQLDRDQIILGRDEGDVTFPTDTFVSGDHCRFIREGHAVYLEDLGSSNGTYIRVRAGQCVAFGGLLLVGHTQFRVHPG